MKKNKTWLIIIIFAILAGIFLNSFYFKIVNIGGKNFIAHLAITPQAQKKGLGNRDRLCGHCAMFFDFKRPGNYAFWMKNMRFDLDILWISEGQVVYIEKHFSKDSQKTVKPSILADQVLEINAGLSDAFDIKVGDSVKIY